MLKLGAPGIRGRNTFYIGPSSKKAFDPASLFENGEQGFWLDPSDLSTMFQDVAGTIPVTGFDQPVGLILDKSGNINHAIQPDSAKRPNLIKKGVWQGDGIDDFLYLSNTLSMTQYTVISRTYVPKSLTKFNILLSTGVTSYPYRATDSVALQGADSSKFANIAELDTVILTYNKGLTRMITSIDDKTYQVPNSWLSGPTPIHIGIFSPTGSSKSSAEYGDFLVIDRILTSDEIASLTDYMQRKWGAE